MSCVTERKKLRKLHFIQFIDGMAQSISDVIYKNFTSDTNSFLLHKRIVIITYLTLLTRFYSLQYALDGRLVYGIRTSKFEMIVIEYYKSLDIQKLIRLKFNASIFISSKYNHISETSVNSS